MIEPTEYHKGVARKFSEILIGELAPEDQKEKAEYYLTIDEIAQALTNAGVVDPNATVKPADPDVNPVGEIFDPHAIPYRRCLCGRQVKHDEKCPECGRYKS